LSYGYTVLTGKMSSVLQSVGFDPYVGYLHSVHYGRPPGPGLGGGVSPLIVDSVIITCINTGALKPEDLTEEVGTCVSPSRAAGLL
jgi:CRISP-associated protein Cas1